MARLPRQRCGDVLFERPYGPKKRNFSFVRASSEVGSFPGATTRLLAELCRVRVHPQLEKGSMAVVTSAAALNVLP